MQFEQLSAREKAALTRDFERARGVWRPTRRGVLKLGAVAGVGLLAPTQKGCADPLSAILLGIALLELLKESFRVAEEVEGFVQLVNSGDEPFRGEMGMSLLMREDLIDQGVGLIEVPPRSDPEYRFGDLHGDDSGDHQVEAQVGSERRRSTTFELVG